MKYRKKSLIEAERWNTEGLNYSEDSLLQQGMRAHISQDAAAIIETKQGWQPIYPGDWLITNPDGERYPCNDKTFKDTYEEVLEDL